MATIKDVAKHAGVSVSTASIALRGRGPVSEETRARVIQAAEALKYRPNEIARGLVTKRSHMVGLVLPDITDPYFHEVAKGVERVLSAAGYTVILADTDRSPEKELRSVEVLQSRRADGLILAGSGTANDPAVHSLLQEGMKVVAVGRHEIPVPSVQINNAAAAEKVVEHVVSRGRTRIAFIAGPRELTTSADRLLGYRRAVERAGLGFDGRLVVQGDFTLEGGRHAVAELFRGRRPAPDAVVAANDQMAIGALRGLRDLGLEIPRDVAVAGIGDIPTAVYVEPTLTTVALPLARMGEEAARMLLRLIDGEESVSHLYLETRLEIRRSTGSH